ncbi:hypothetical protein HJC23_013018 [Cyclotella cryptica]|uniref:Uncharacterized protein n=1 Tax=Cyclotella cryptica TaxID=29204 RepID=A0ABD3QFX4_9STRA|eukprot:CCRYP_005631-RA/>CCRYP_005631-RA protein AED:0.01 eAED:0.01 QI:259/1/1/1/1/1/2/1625/612
MSSTTTHRYVPQGPASLSSDAPGWSAADVIVIETGANPTASDGNDDINVKSNASERSNDGETKGPICWKCKGTCQIPLRAHERKRKQTTQGQPLRGEDANVKVPPESRNADATHDTSKTIPRRSCPVCSGAGYLPMRARYVQSLASSPPSNGIGGSITARRRRPQGWKEFGPVPPVVRACQDFMKSKPNNHNGQKETVMDYALSILSEANGPEEDYVTPRNDVFISLPIPSSTDDTDTSSTTTIKWLPIHQGEQLCNLVGRWRIIQRIGSHRWTTDDLVTAYVGASTFVSRLSQSKLRGKTIRYLDLGTGNASVLQMVTWYLLSRLSGGDGGGDAVLNPCDLKAVGVEARSEAVGLARRSLSFNLDTIEYNDKVYTGTVTHHSQTGLVNTEPFKCNVQIVQGDFRDLVSLSKCNNDQEARNSEDQELKEVSSQRYDLITGTPPYFRVDFSSSSSAEVKKSCDSKSSKDNREVITAAIIQQGGMPTSMQSAPARCEFRGGVEAYCETASAMLAQDGVFAVCENWLNNDRVWNGAKHAGLDIDAVWPVMGKVGKKDPLFAVYVMRKAAERSDMDSFVSEKGREKIQPPIVVRDGNGKWTDGYAKIMDAMSIPVL